MKVIDKHILQIQDIPIEIEFKNIKNLHIAVCPPDGKVRVSAPIVMNEEKIKIHLIPRIQWIKKQIQKFQNQERQSKREMLSGESHYFEGRRYILIVKHSESKKSSVKILNSTQIQMTVPSNASREIKEKILENWYRKELKKRLPPLIEKWQKIIGVEVNKITIRKMKTLWGSCNPSKKSILLNLELMKKPTQCLEYILVHEMVHLIERHHNERFHQLMDKFLPNWRTLKTELNKHPLPHSEWKY